MPITQARMQAVLTESQQLADHIQTLRDEAEIILRSGLSTSQRFTLLLRLIKSQAPAAPQSAREREHFTRHAERNAQQRTRMQRLRQRQQENVP